MAMARDDTSLTRGIVHVIESIAGLFSKTLEVFLRYEFGERYFGVVGLLVVYLLSWFINFMAWMIGVVGPLVGHFLPGSTASFWSLHESKLIPVFSHVFLLVGSLQVIITWVQNRQGVASHTRYSGKCIPLWYLIPGMTEDRIKRFGEPAVCFALCVFYLDGVDPVFSSYIRWAAISLFIKANLEYTRKRGMGLDVLDMQYEAEELNALLGKLKRPAGAVVAEAATFATPSRPSPGMFDPMTPSGFEDLSPELQSLFGVQATKKDYEAAVEIDGEVMIDGAVMVEDDFPATGGTILITCPGCGASGNSPARFAGRKVRCRKCGASATHSVLPD